ncbi:MAG: ATP synthase subunit I [Caldimonas sp.]
MLKVALPRPSSDAVIRGDGRAAFTNLGFDDEREAPVRPLTRAEAADLVARQPVLSPWRVVAAQVLVGIVVAALVHAFTGDRLLVASALYGAAVVAVPGALMARGATSRLGTISPLISTVNVMGWATVKMVVSVVMLALASRIVPGLNWPLMLAALVLCMLTYPFALLWRVRPAQPN